MLKTLRLSLDSIKLIFKEKNAHNILITLLDEQLKVISRESEQLQQKKSAIEAVKENITMFNSMKINSVKDITTIMNGKKKLRQARITLVAGGIFMDIIEIATAVFWYKTGICNRNGSCHIVGGFSRANVLPKYIVYLS